MNKILEVLKRNWVIVLLLVSYLIIFLWQEPIGLLLSNPDTQKLLGESIYDGWLGLVDYLSAHVLLCLIPAFFIAGAINTLIDSQVILKYLSNKSKKVTAYLIASMGGFFIQVCSCTILPLFAGIWKKGAGLGVAITFLYAGPAINLLAFVLTGQRLGWDFGIIRLVLSIFFAILTGVLMELIFRKDINGDGELITSPSQEFSLKGKKSTVFWLLLGGILIIGTAPINEMVKYITVGILTLIEIVVVFKWLTKRERSAWWKETVKFLSEIVPLLLLGVFLAGVLTSLIPQDKFQALVGQNTLFTNFIAVLFGAIAYFPALVEIPIAESFLELGMHKGPLMSYLLSDPVLSLQGLLIISKLIGVKKTVAYAVIITVLTTLAGYTFGLIF